MKWFLFVLKNLGVVLLMCACTSHQAKHKSEQAVRVDTVMRAGEMTSLQFPGKVKAAQDVNLSFRVSGTIRKICVEDGAYVRAGQLLAELDPTDYQVQLRATEAEYLQVKSEAERVMALYEENGTTANANDKAVYGLRQITAKYQHHKDQLAYTRLYAPFNGFVQKHLFDMYETVGAGMPVVSMVSDSSPEVEINLPAAEYIRRGKFVRFYCTFDVYPGRVYPLELIGFMPKANANQLYSMRMRLVPGNHSLPSPGMNTMVTIDCDTAQTRLLAIPSGALLRQNGKTSVLSYCPDTRKVHEKEVGVVRLQSDGTCVVTSKQLKVGDVVVSSGVHHVKDGETVKLLPVITKTNIGGML